MTPIPPRGRLWNFLQPVFFENTRTEFASTNRKSTKKYAHVSVIRCIPLPMLISAWGGVYVVYTYKFSDDGLGSFDNPVITERRM